MVSSGMVWQLEEHQAPFEHGIKADTTVGDHQGGPLASIGSGRSVADRGECSDGYAAKAGTCTDARAE